MMPRRMRNSCGEPRRPPDNCSVVGRMDVVLAAAERAQKNTVGRRLRFCLNGRLRSGDDPSYDRLDNDGGGTFRLSSSQRRLFQCMVGPLAF